MNVFLRTGRDSAVSFSWWFYLLVVLPLQLLLAFWKAVLWLVIMVASGALWLARTGRTRWLERKENGPPTP